MCEDIKKVQTQKKTLTPTDKISNTYRLIKNDYQNPWRNANTTTYKRPNKILETKINKKGKKFAKQAYILDKIGMNGSGNFFVTLKDHKEKFINDPTARLINSSKKEMGRIKKHIFDQSIRIS